MKNLLINHLLDDAELQMEIDGHIEELLLKSIDRFFEKYQPDRLNRETTKVDAIVET